MVHEVPNSAGRVDIAQTDNKVGYVIANLSVTNTITVAPRGKDSIILPPYTKLKIPDKIQIVITGANSDRNFLVMQWDAGRDS